MAAKKIKVERYHCTCELPDCVGKGKPWVTRGENLPTRCRWCKRHTWNGVDRRVDRVFTPEERARNSASAKKRWDHSKKGAA